MTELTTRPSPARYAAAFGALAAAIALRWLLDPALGALLPLVTLFGAVAVAVWAAGVRCALIVAVLGYAACDYLFISPRGAFGVGGYGNLIGAAAFLLSSGVLIAFGEAARRAQLRSRAGEAAAQERAETLRITLASVGDAVITTDVNGNVSSLNPVAESLTGWSSADAASLSLTSVFTIVNEETRRPIENPVARVLAERRVIGLANHTLLISRQGNAIPIDDSAAPILDAAGQIVGVVLVFHEISERRAAEQREREIRAETLQLLELNRAIVTNMAEGLYTVDRQGMVTFLNPAAERLLGWSSAELVGRKMHDATHYKHPDGRPFPIEECAGFQVLHDGKVLVDHEDNFIKKDGSFLPVAYCSSPLLSGGETVGLVVVFRDTTEQKWADQQLRTLATDLAAADRRKDEFLATLAHELRNPLAPLRTALEIIRRSVGDTQAIERAQVIMERQLSQLIHLVDDLLDVSRIRLGKITLRKERLELLSVLNNAVETSRPRIEAGRHEIVVELPPEPVLLEADSTRLVQIFSNILNNAARHSAPGGRIRVTAVRQGSDVLVSIKDTGYGIPPDRLPHIFELFSQIHHPLQKSQEGLGIGLALVQRLVALHGGSVDAQSDGVGQGSEFIVRLPAVPEAVRYSSAAGSGQ